MRTSGKDRKPGDGRERRSRGARDRRRGTARDRRGTRASDAAARIARRRRRPAALLSYGRPEIRTHAAASDRVRRGWPRAVEGDRRSEDWRESWDRARERGRVRTWLQRQRERAGSSRFRKPLVGLAMAGAAAPLVRASEQPTVERRVDRAAAADSAEETAEKLALERQDRIREQAVEGAVDRYGIPRGLAENIHDIAAEEGIEAEVAYGLVRTESTFRHRAVSHAGARGLTQLMPRTARWLMPEIGSAEQLFDEQTNLRVGFRYLRYLLDKYQGNLELALLAYNRGPGTVDRVLSRGGNPDNGYARKVLEG